VGGKMADSFIGIVNYPLYEDLSNIEHNTLKGLSYQESGHIGFQPDTDTTLLTIDKTITGAINELYNKLIVDGIPKLIFGGNPTTKGNYIIDGGYPDSKHVYIVNGGTPTI